MIRHIYENYIMRDLNYVISGIISSTSIVLVADNNLLKSFLIYKNILDYMTNNLYIFLLFLIAAYAVGIICTELCILCKVMKVVLENPRDKEVDFLIFVTELYEAENNEAVKLFERITYLKFVGASYGSAFMLSSIVGVFTISKEIYYFGYVSKFSIIFCLGATVSAFIGYRMNRRFWNKSNQLLIFFRDKIDKQHRNSHTAV